MNTKNRVFTKVASLVCKWPAGEKAGKVGANQYLPRTAKKVKKDTGCGGELGVGIREGFIGRHLTLVRTNPESRQIKA